MAGYSGVDCAGSLQACSRVSHAASRAMELQADRVVVPIRPLTEFLCSWSRTYNCTTLVTGASPPYTTCYGHSHPQDLLTLLHRVEGELGVPREVIVAGLVYADRVRKASQTPVCGYCITLGCLILALKYLDDEVCQVNQRWAWLAGMELSRFNQLELFVLRIVSCGLYIEPSMFDTWANALTMELALPWVQQQQQQPSTPSSCVSPTPSASSSTTTPVLVATVPQSHVVASAPSFSHQVPVAYNVNLSTRPMTYINPWGVVLLMPSTAGAEQYVSKSSVTWC